MGNNKALDYFLSQLDIKDESEAIKVLEKLAMDFPLALAKFDSDNEEYHSIKGMVYTRVLEQAGNNQIAASKFVQIPRSTFRDKGQKYGAIIPGPYVNGNNSES